MAETSLTSPYLPRLMDVPSGQAPRAPTNVASTGLDRSMLLGLALKAASMVPHFTLEWASKKLLLPQGVIAELMEELRDDALLEMKGQDEAGGSRYAISQRGRDQAAHASHISAYVGPAPVTLEAYTAYLEYQMERNPAISQADIEAALSSLTIDREATEIAALAVSSGRSVFLSGPAGNGKTSMGRMLHTVLKGDLWIPHCLAVENNIVRLYDAHCHHAVDKADATNPSIDQRWVRIHRPLIVAGGEMTLEALDLAYHEGVRFYEAPLHVKANGGTFLIDDFGRQRVAPDDLLNRWIIPLEHRLDFLTLHTGQKIEVPFLLMLIIATNLDPKDVTDPAFLRRIGYRLRLSAPTVEQYRAIFEGYAEREDIAVAPELIDSLLSRYEQSGRELRSCEPRDLLERVKDICQLHNKDKTLSEELLTLAWKGYFGEELKET